MRILAMSALLTMAALPMQATAQTTAPAATPLSPASAASGHYTTDDTDLGTLLDDPAAKAVLMKHIPALISNEQIDMARSMTLKTLQNYAGDQLTEAKLVAIDADFAKLPPKK